MWTLIVMLSFGGISTEQYFSKETCEAVGQAVISMSPGKYVCIHGE